MEHESISRGLGADYLEPPRLRTFSITRVITDGLKLTLKTAPRWLLLFGILAVLYVIPLHLSGQMYASHAERETAANLVVLAMMPISLIFMSAFYRMLLAGSRGESLNVLQLLAFGVKRLPRAVATFGLLWICMMGAFALLAMLAVGVAMAIGKTAGMMFGMSLYVVVIALVVVGGIRWQLAPLVCILEDKSMFAVLKRSNQLVSGRLVSFIGTTFASMVLSYMLIIGAILLCLVVTLLGTSMKVSSPVLAGVVWVVPLVISYGIAVLLPLSAQFLAYYTLTEGEELSADLRQNGSYYP